MASIQVRYEGRRCSTALLGYGDCEKLFGLVADVFALNWRYGVASCHSLSSVDFLRFFRETTNLVQPALPRQDVWLHTSSFLRLQKIDFLTRGTLHPSA